jgi:short-subunit dehydrogenase
MPTMSRIESALVTGASGGLGAAIARCLAAEGVKVVVTGRRHDPLERLARETGATPVVCDLADRADLTDLLARAGQVDVLVSNAALPASGTVDDFSVEQIDRAIDVNLRSPVLLARAAAAGMVSRGHGQIVVVSSMGAKVISPQLALYAATKSGLRAFALGLREDLRPRGVGVTVILPGPIRDAGMWADTGVTARRGLGTRSATDVAAAVVRAVRHNPPEITVAPLALRGAAALCALRPGWFAALARQMGAEREASQLASAQRHLR